MKRKSLNSPLRSATFAYFRVDLITSNPENPRKHDRAQIAAIAKSIEAFGFNAPILLDRK